LPRKSFLLRIDQKLYEEIEAWAQQEMRSVNGQIEFMLRQATNKYKGKGTKIDLRKATEEATDNSD
jgi:hypothetical protein